MFSLPTISAQFRTKTFQKKFILKTLDGPHISLYVLTFPPSSGLNSLHTACLCQSLCLGDTIQTNLPFQEILELF